MDSGRIDLVVKANGREIKIDLSDPSGVLGGSNPFLGDALLWIQAAARECRGLEEQPNSRSVLLNSKGMACAWK